MLRTMTLRRHLPVNCAWAPWFHLAPHWTKSDIARVSGTKLLPGVRIERVRGSVREKKGVVYRPSDDGLAPEGNMEGRG